MLRHLKNGKKSSLPRIYFHLILYIYNKMQKIALKQVCFLQNELDFSH